MFVDDRLWCASYVRQGRELKMEWQSAHNQLVIISCTDCLDMFVCHEIKLFVSVCLIVLFFVLCSSQSSTLYLHNKHIWFTKYDKMNDSIPNKKVWSFEYLLICSFYQRAVSFFQFFCQWHAAKKESKKERKKERIMTHHQTS